MNWFHLSLAALMLVTGSINTLSVKWADTMTSESTDGNRRGFNHPFMQACGMFVGEMMCMVAHHAVVWWRRRKARQGRRDPDPAPTPFNPLVFLPPALCDMTATSIQYIGLTLTYAASFQMLRGAVIIFTGILSRIALKKKLFGYKWAGIVFVIGGLFTVGICDVLYSGGGGNHNSTVSTVEGKPFFHPEYLGNIIRGYNSERNKSSSDILLGDILIVSSQVIVATQMVYEEKFVTKYNVPALQAVGWEGTFGFVTLSTLLIPMYFIPVGEKFGHNPRHVMEDAYDGLYQLAHNPLLLMAFCGTAISIAFFNFAGISVTKEMSATTRMVLDSMRTVIIWAVSIAVGWQSFYALQLLGFVILLTGMCIYNDIVVAPAIRFVLRKCGCFARADDEETIIDEEVEPESSIFESQADTAAAAAARQEPE